MEKAPSHSSRRSMIFKSVYGLSSISAISLLGSCEKLTGDEIAPPEDLMREHGIIRRIMLIYDECRSKLIANEPVDPDVLLNSARIIRTFIEEYHEKLEENYIFPAFNNSNRLIDMVETLKIQHRAGRTITDQIMKNAATANEPPGDLKNSLVSSLENFNIMYRAHASREDTVLFPAIREIMTGKKFREMGDEFENQEIKSFGKNGFEDAVNKVTEIERNIGIFELDRYNRQ